MINSFFSYLLNMDNMVSEAFFRVIPALICITFHELAHGYTAYRLGDNTAKDMGRLTLNPIKHIDVFGLLMMLIAYFGWAKPVPVNMRNFKRPKWGMAVTALAGPMSNLLLTIAVLLVFGLVLTPLSGFAAGEVALIMMHRMAMIGIALAVFNMLPIPPLDGSKILFSLLPDRYYMILMKYERYGMLVLFVGLYFFRDALGVLISNISGAFDVIWHTTFLLVN